jgi:Etoposide-induced protein 2.4 (EI24)
MLAKKKAVHPEIQWRPMSGKAVIYDLFSRTIIVVIFSVSCLAGKKLTVWPLTVLIEILTQSLLTAFYCFEYKTAAAGVDTTTGLMNFEKQWIYWFGFGFPFAATQYLF